MPPLDEPCKRCGGSDWYIEPAGWRRCKPCRLADRKALRQEKANARAGWSPAHDMTKPVPDGFAVQGVSTLYGADGAVAAQWIKTRAERQTFADLMDAARDALLSEPYRGKAEPVERPVVDDDLLCIVPFGDPHFGMQSWHRETGEDFDLKTAEQDVIEAIEKLFACAPRAGRLLLGTVGDTTHADSDAAATTAGTRVDVDTRWLKVLTVVVRVYRHCIDRALKQFGHVTFFPVRGNHDSMTAMSLGLILQAYYENEPRVHVDVQPGLFHYYEFGKCLIGWTHGHTVKKEALPGIMAFDRREAWGRTEHRVWITGHIHHETVKEFPGCRVKSYPTLAPRDAWHAGQGYRSGRDVRLEVWHRELGERYRHIVGIQEIRQGRN